MEVTVDLRKEQPDFILKLETICKLFFKKSGSKREKIGTFYWSKVWSSQKRFQCSTSNIMEILKGCLVGHRFWQAAQILENISLKLGNATSGIYAKNSLYVLENLKQESTRDIAEFFIRQVKVIRELNKNELLLEYLMFRLRSQQFDFPRETVQSVKSVKLIHKRNNVFDPILGSYITLFDYILWAKAASSLSNSHVMEGSQNICENIISSWCKIIEKPGIWDIFLEKLVQVLLSKSDYEQCDQLLKCYTEAHPDHLNAYVYLELYKNEIDRKERKANLKKIADMSPSDQLVIDYVDTLLQDEEFSKAIKYMFLFLDYSVNKESLRGWTTLVDVVCVILQSHLRRPLQALKHNWKERCGYWIQYHFDVDCVDFGTKHQSQLCVQKVLFLCTVLKSTDHPYIHSTFQNLKTSYPKRLKKLEAKIEIILILNKELFL